MSLELPSFTCPVAAANFAIVGFVVPSPRYCRMGQDYDCTCHYCSPSRYVAAQEEATKKNIATEDTRAEMLRVASSLDFLSRIGRAVRVALAPGLGIGHLVNDAGHLWDSAFGELRGAYFCVVGKRGNVGAHHGKVGVCKWTELLVSAEDGGQRGETPMNKRRIGLLISGQEKLAYVSFSQLVRLQTPERVKLERVEADIVEKAVAPHRPRLVVTQLQKTKRGRVTQRGTYAYVVSGPQHVGKSGEVFWQGDDKRTGEKNTRLGVKCEDNSVCWVSVYDCADRPLKLADVEERKLLERIAADAAESGDEENAKLLMSQTRIAEDRTPMDVVLRLANDLLENFSIHDDADGLKTALEKLAIDHGWSIAEVWTGLQSYATPKAVVNTEPPIVVNTLPRGYYNRLAWQSRRYRR